MNDKQMINDINICSHSLSRLHALSLSLSHSLSFSLSHTHSFTLSLTLSLRRQIPDERILGRSLDRKSTRVTARRTTLVQCVL